MAKKSAAADASAKVRINEYIAAVPPDARKALRLIRAIVKDVAPDAVEGFGYGIPGFKLDGRVFVYYAAWKAFVSLYPITTAIRTTHAAALKGYETSKGTVRLPLSQPAPEALIRKLVKARVREVRALAR